MSEANPAGAGSADGSAIGSVEIVRAITAALIGAKDELTALDAVAGDGDMGVTFVAGCTAILDVLATVSDAAPSAVLRAVGVETSRKAPSTAGTLVAFGLLAAAKDTAADELDDTAASFARVLRVVADTVSSRGKSEVGDKTMVDALAPAAAAAREVAAAGGSRADAARAAAAAARTGADATFDLVPKHGRAAWLSGRSAGSPDAGAVAVAIALEAVAAVLAP